MVYNLISLLHNLHLRAYESTVYADRKVHNLWGEIMWILCSNDFMTLVLLLLKL